MGTGGTGSGQTGGTTGTGGSSGPGNAGAAGDSAGAEGAGMGTGGSTSVGGSTGAQVSVDATGKYTVTFAHPAWTFAGTVGAPASAIMTTAGSDAVGSYRETTFSYSNAGTRNGRIRAYDHLPVVGRSAEKTTWLTAPLGAKYRVGVGIAPGPSRVQPPDSRSSAYSG